MLTRGKLIAEILDGLGQLNFALDARGKLGLYNINTYCEDFTKELMNLVYDYNLSNLNADRLNEPGLDLGDEVKRIGVQVTTVKTSEKINHTLSRITAEQKEKYDKFLIMILGKKQRKYSAIDEELAQELCFSEDNILDINDLEKGILSLPVEKIKEVYDFLSISLIKVYGELGFDSTPSGESASLLDRVEAIPEYAFLNCNKIQQTQKERYNEMFSQVEMGNINYSCKELFKALKRLPRVTREFFYVVAYRAEEVGLYYDLIARDEIIKRLIKIDQNRYYEEISILEEADLLVRYEEEAYHYILKITGICKENLCLYHILDTSKHLNLSLKDIIVDLNFQLLAADIEE